MLRPTSRRHGSSGAPKGIHYFSDSDQIEPPPFTGPLDCPQLAVAVKPAAPVSRRRAPPGEESETIRSGPPREFLDTSHRHGLHASLLPTCSSSPTTSPPRRVPLFQKRLSACRLARSVRNVR
jgi:hypothetical protein